MVTQTYTCIKFFFEHVFLFGVISHMKYLREIFILVFVIVRIEEWLATLPTIGAIRNFTRGSHLASKIQVKPRMCPAPYRANNGNTYVQINNNFSNKMARIIWEIVLPTLSPACLHSAYYL